MVTYWFLYIIPAISAIQAGKQKSKSILSWVILAFIFILIIGLRHEVGGDWFNYLGHFEMYLDVPLSIAFEQGDPGYVFLNWSMGKIGLDHYAVNFICAIIFVSGLFAFARHLPYPWLGIAVAVPYLVVVVAMGYTRQGVALGFLFWGLTQLEQKRFKSFIFSILLAALFHKTAIIMVGLALFTQGKGKLLRLLATLAIGYGLWSSFLAEDQANLWHNYVEAAMHSEGARIRAFMNLVPGLLLLFFWKKWKNTYPNPKFWLWMAVGSIVVFPLVDFASTAVDRMALYMTPLQVAVFARLPELVYSGNSKTVIIGVLFGYALTLFVWLNFATHAPYWLPYQNWLFS